MSLSSFMEEAINLSAAGMANNQGGPFGAVVVKNGVIIARGNNQVTSTNDPTAHAEIVAIRNACAALGTFQLTGCEIYTSCEPCPMCLGAIYWARPDKVFFANTRHQAADIGFDDFLIYEEINQPTHLRKIPFIHQPHPAALEVFKAWAKKTDKTEY